MLNNPIDVKRTYGSSLVPAQMWDSLRSEVEGLFDRFAMGFASPEFRPLEHFWPRSMTGCATLNVDVFKTDKAYIITAEIPGVDEKDLEIDVSDDAVMVSGKKLRKIEETEENDLYISERSYGAFQRTFALPKDADRKNVSAKYAYGILTVTIPRLALADNLHRIHVKAA
jgi:HSP20 family protein